MFSRKHLVYASAVLIFALLLVAIGFVLYGGSGRVSFEHGVASGDPLDDRVILWTRVTPQESQRKVRVRIEVASDEKFESLVYSSVKSATAENDYTVKVDVEGLSAGTAYYYRFRSGEVRIRYRPYQDLTPGRCGFGQAGGVFMRKLSYFSWRLL